MLRRHSRTSSELVTSLTRNDVGSPFATAQVISNLFPGGLTISLAAPDADGRAFAAFVPPKWCRKWYVEHISIPPLWAFINLLADSELRHHRIRRILSLLRASMRGHSALALWINHRTNTAVVRDALETFEVDLGDLVELEPDAALLVALGEQLELGVPVTHLEAPALGVGAQHVLGRLPLRVEDQPGPIATQDDPGALIR